MKYIQLLKIFFIILILPQIAKAQTQTSTSENTLLKIDFSQKTSPVQLGFEGFFAEHEVANTFIAQSFQVEGENVLLKVEWPAGTSNQAKQMIDRDNNSNAEMNDLIRDWVGTDGRSAKVPMILTINNLPDGVYDWISYHHDNNDQTGIFSVKIEDAQGLAVKGGIDISNGIIPFENVTVFNTTIKSNGNEIKLSFELDSYPDNSTSFFVMNGFTIGLSDTILPDIPVFPEQTQLVSPLNNIQNGSLNPILKWTESNFTDSYNVYFGTENPPKLIANVQSDYYTASVLLPNTNYYWKIETVNKYGTAVSETRSFTTEEINAPIFMGNTNLEFSHFRKFYTEGFELKLTTNNPSANIIYTLDSSTPSAGNGLVYKEGIFIDSTVVVKAVAISGRDTSKVITNTFLFSESIKKQGKSPFGFPKVWGGSSLIGADYEMDPEIINDPVYTSEISKALQSIPSVSLTMDIDDWFDPVAGLYKGYPNSNISVEKAVTAEFMFEDTNENFSVECGVQNQGGTSIINWKVPKQSMRLLFKEMYGPTKLNYKLFPDSDIKSINTLVLDGLLYSWIHPFDDKQRVTSLYFRDQLASDLQNKMGGTSFHGIYVNLFINGLYWGIYDLHERPDEDFLEEYLDADKDEFDIIKHNPKTIVHGSNAAYLQLLQQVRNGLSTPGSLKNIQNFLDLPAFIDYMILNFYLGNYDWAHQNYYAAQNKVKQTGFRFYTWDAEHVMRYSKVDYYNLDKTDEGGPTEIHTMLKQNKEYRMMFADAVYRHFFNNGVLTPASFEESFLFRKNEIESAIILESARWGDYRKELSGVTYTKNDYWIPEVNKVLEEYIPRRRDIVLSQLRNHNPQLFPTYMPPVFISDNQSSELRKTVELINPNSVEGDIYYTLDGTDPRAEGGAVHGLKYSEAIIVESSTLIRTRFLPKVNKEWSALSEKSFVFKEIYGKELVITEIMYHPEKGFPEYIELVNTGETNIILNGFLFAKGIDYTFQAGSSITPNAGLVLTNDTTLFKNVYGFSAFGQYSKRLNNGGEILILENSYNQIVDSISYLDTIPWPMAAGGGGYSLELVNWKSDNSNFSNWKVSDNKNGTPVEPKSIEESETTLYPNPFTNKVYINIGNQELVYETFVVEVFNLYGSKIKTLELNNNNLNLEIPTNDLGQGVYIFQIQTKQITDFGIQNFKAIKL